MDPLVGDGDGGVERASVLDDHGGVGGEAADLDDEGGVAEIVGRGFEALGVWIGDAGPEQLGLDNGDTVSAGDDEDFRRLREGEGDGREQDLPVLGPGDGAGKSFLPEDAGDGVFEGLLGGRREGRAVGGTGSEVGGGGGAVLSRGDGARAEQPQTDAVATLHEAAHDPIDKRERLRGGHLADAQLGGWRRVADQQDECGDPEGSECPDAGPC